MREKTLKLVVTFATTADALAMESLGRTGGVPGRIIPVPSQIDSGCGLAWCVEASQKEDLLRGISQYGVAYEGFYEVMLY